MPTKRRPIKTTRPAAAVAVGDADFDLADTTPLADVPELATYQTRLKALGYSTLEDFVGAAQVARPELEQYLGVAELDRLLGTVQSLPATLSAAEQAMIDENPCELGALIDEVPRPAVALAVEPLEDASADCANLVQEMPPVKNQQARGTCVAFAATAVYEHYLLNVTHSLSTGQGMSEQFLYWDCKRSDGIPNTSGTWLGVAFPALRRDGQCLEPTWTYVPQPVPGNEGQGPPPPSAVVEALRYRVPGIVQIAPTSVADIRAKLTQRRCVAFSIPVFNSWYANAYVKRSPARSAPAATRCASSAANCRTNRAWGAGGLSCETAGAPPGRGRAVTARVMGRFRSPISRNTAPRRFLCHDTKTDVNLRSARTFMPLPRDFIDELPVTNDVRSRLRALGARSPFALAGLISASRSSFAGHFGDAVARTLIDWLLPRLSAAQRAELNAAPPRYATGAMSGPAPRFYAPAMDTDHRERLFERLEMLRSEPGGEFAHRVEIERLEREIASLY